MLAFGKPLETYDEQVPAKFLPVGSRTFDGRVAATVTKGDPAILWSNIPMLPAETLAKIEQRQDERKRNPGVRPALRPSCGAGRVRERSDSNSRRP